MPQDAIISQQAIPFMADVERFKTRVEAFLETQG
jgi:benzoyl-CoA reductase/2-hydroxyglutaryl-CoA dehydratase subunit BcrC/BadD/HgdB